MRYTTKRSEYYSRMTVSVGERLWSEVDTINGNRINWDVFTTDYVKDSLPKPKTYEETVYHDWRSKWVEDINEYFLTSKYPCRLSVAHRKGVVLRKVDAVDNRMNQRMRQHDSFIERSTGEFERMLEAPFTPVECNKMKGFIDMFRGLNQLLEPVKSLYIEDQKPAVVEQKFITTKRAAAAEILYDTRMKKGMTQTELADIIGYHSSYISKMENGVSPIGELIALELGKALDIDYRKLIS